MARPKPPKAQCQNCQKEYQPKEANRATYCSRECYFESIKAAPRLITPMTCIICRQPFQAIGKSNRLTCSTECSHSHSRNIINARGKARHASEMEERIPITKECEYCKKPFSVSKYPMRKYCSLSCTKRAYRHTDQGKEQHRNVKLRRRARLAGVELTGVAWLEVLDRDGWRCGICGGTINRKVTVPHPQAPTVDHIIPLAKGGPHTAANLQAAHFICNTRKSDRGGGQLRLAI